MKKIFLIFALLFALAGLVTGNYELTGIACVGAIAFTGSAKKTVLAVGLVPALIFSPDGKEIPAFTRSQKALFDWLRINGNEITKNALNQGKLVWNPVTYYIRAAITGLSGRQKILGTSTSKVLGICNLDKGLLPQYYNFCYDKIAVRYGTTAVSATDSPASLAGYSSVRSSMAPGLSNGDLIISLNGIKQIETPISDFTSNAAITGGGSRDFDGGELQVPKVWQENLQVDVEVNLPIVIPSAANTSYFVEVQFYGIEARLN